MVSRFSISTSACSSCNAGLPTGITVREKDIPYTDTFTATATIDDQGSTLSVGDVTLVCPPNSLPENTNVSVMVIDVERDQPVNDSTYLSPLVVITPSDSHGLGEPFQLSLPLHVRPGWPVRVKASFTSAFERPNWVELPSTDFETRDGGVDVVVRHLCLFQAECGMRIENRGDDMHFSVSYFHSNKEEYFLRVACSTDLDYCSRAVGSFSLAHDIADTEFQAVPFYGTMHLAVTLATTDGSILQLYSTLDEKARSGLLDHSFVIHPITPGKRDESGRLIGRRGENSTWTVRLQSPVGKGHLHACGVQRSKTPQGKVEERKDSSGGKRLCFSIPYVSYRSSLMS